MPFSLESNPSDLDLNNCRINGSNKIHVWFMPNESANSPVEGTNTRVFYIASSDYLDTYGTQIVLAPYRNNIWMRCHSKDGLWDDWKIL